MTLPLESTISSLVFLTPVKALSHFTAAVVTAPTAPAIGSVIPLVIEPPTFSMLWPILAVLSPKLFIAPFTVFKLLGISEAFELSFFSEDTAPFIALVKLLSRAVSTAVTVLLCVTLFPPFLNNFSCLF